MPDLWKPPPTLSVHQLEGLPVIGYAHGPKDTAPWSTRPGNRTRYSIHAVDAAQSKLLVSVSSVVLGGGTEYPHPQRGVTGWAALTCFDLILLTHLRTSGSYAGYQCHHHVRAYPEARPCWHCKARPPEAQCTHFPMRPTRAAPSGVPANPYTRK